MPLLQIFAMACMVIYTQGANCKENQHCAECDENTGRCSTRCSTGYFGPKCMDVCSRRCRYHTCKLIPGKGIETCTDGCIPGFQGPNCQRPCYSTKEHCTRCPDGCLGEYCHMGGTCFSGCSDSYYGAGCKFKTSKPENNKTCSSRCKSCNRITGTCEECQPPYSGLDCRSSCEHCVGGCESGCQQGCRQGFYGNKCTEACSDTCRAGPSLSADEQCPEGDSCTPECHSQTGECVHGCVDGWYGPKCSKRCFSNCKHQRCNHAGVCVERCGKCLNKTCNVSCMNGCNSRDNCNMTCDLCPGGVCDENSGSCVQGCNTTGSRCGDNCTTNCQTTDCPTGSCHADEQTTGALNTVIVTSVGLVVFIILAACTTCCICCRKRKCLKRNEAEDNTLDSNLEQADTSIRESMDLHHYEDIREEDIMSQLPDQNQDGAGREKAPDIPVLADCFQGELNDKDTSVGDSQPYTELKEGARVSRPRSSIRYLSPHD
ncbi:scavenger receptor class F member 1-like [Haliotis cracherodii]|uniref:scavenger receptor class F member 1-like n=1 Tax=Haliotis cracherodii TaxID=6455 RepID=UPI0039E99044